jgi:hypothetical protein
MPQATKRSIKHSLKHFHSSFVVTLLGLIFGACVGYWYEGSLKAAASALFLTFILSILEVSLSFDNAVVNATVLRNMTPLWRHRFITWGMLIAVFGMRIFFPVVIVSIVAKISPWAALQMATFHPHDYAATMLEAHTSLAGFGGSFLFMVCLRYFFDESKDVHWFVNFERALTKMGKVAAIEVSFCLLLAYMVSLGIDSTEKQLSFLVSSIAGVITFVAVDGLSSILHVPEGQQRDLEKASAAMFLYLEILDASFSFDGVIGAFALTHNLFIIAAGLGIGAMFVRSMTIALVEHETLDEFRYLEHGAFYAIGALASVMFFDVFVHVPEVLTGLIGAVIIGLSLFSSIRHKRQRARTQQGV